MRNAFVVLVVGLVALLIVPTGEAAISTIYSDFASWSAAVGAYQMQDFEGYADHQNLYGIDVLSGVNVTSNLANVVAWAGGPDTNLFGYDDTTREQGIAYYDINLTLPYCAVAFDVDGWDPIAPGPATAEIFFADLTSISVEYLQTGPTDTTPVFFGITSSSAITRIRWNEGTELGGQGNEEVGIDNLAVSRTCIPEPSMLSLFGFVLLLFVRRLSKR